MSNVVWLNVTTEGPSELAFVKDALAKCLVGFNVMVQGRPVLTSQDKHRSYRGGMYGYQRVKKDIQEWIKMNQHSDKVFFTTMFDFYGLPNDFPEYSALSTVSSAYDQVSMLEKGLADDIGYRHFIPYIQLHEFETLLFANPQNFSAAYRDEEKSIASLEKIVTSFGGNPELINDGRETAPSKRIIQLFPKYRKDKVRIGSVLAGFDGIPFLKSRCRHFSDWVDKLEKLGQHAN